MVTPTDQPVLEARVRLALMETMPVLSVDDGIEALLGFTVEDFLASRVVLRDRIHPDDGDISEQLFSFDYQGRSGACNLRLRHADGRIRCVKAYYTKQPQGAARGAVLDLHLQDAKSLWVHQAGQIMMVNFKAMMENTDDYIYFKDRNHVFTGASQTLVSITDPSVHWTDLLGQTDYDVFPEAYADIYYRLEKQVFAGIPVAHEIQEFLDNQDNQGWVDNRKYPIRDDSGEIIGLFGIARDISEKMSVELALRREREKLQLILDYAPIGIWLQDGGGKMSFVNNAFCQAMGIPEARFLAVPHYAELMPEAFRPQCLASDAKALASGDVSVTHQQLPFVDGQVHDLRVLKAVKRDENGAPVALVGLSLDITEELRRERALRENEIKFHTMLDWTYDWEYWISPEGRFHYMTPSVERITGYPASFFQAKPELFDQLVHPEDQDLWRRHLDETAWEMQSGQAREVDLRLIHRDGSSVWVTHSVRPVLDAEGHCLGRRGTVRDIGERKRLEASREAALTRLRLIASRVPGVLCEYRLRPDGSSCFPFASDAIRDIFHVSPEEVREDSTKVLAMTHPDDMEALIASIRQSAAAMTPWRHEYRIQLEDGSVRWLFGNSLPRREEDGSVLWHGFVTDMTESKQAEEKVHLAASVFSHAREGILIAAADGAIIEINDAFTRITGYDRDEVCGLNPRFLNSGRQSDEFYALMWRALAEQGHWSGEIWNRRKNGEIFAAMETISAVRDARGDIRQYVALFTDITPLKDHERRLEHIAHYDSLTGLPNRVLLADRLHQAMAQALRRGQKLAVAYIDLDGFKAVNDRHGHDVGDLLLVAVAASMKQALREGDTLARLGGDEFVAVLLDLADSDTAEPLLARLLAAASEPLISGSLTLRVSASVGVTHYPQTDEVDADQLLRQADQAMYQAKLAGKSRYHSFDAELDRSARGHHESLERIRRALAAREFVLHYQPKVNLRRGTVIGVEALIRWNHPLRGQLPPAVFLPVIENHALIVELGEWVIESALLQLEAWREDGLDLPISVNIAARQLQQANFVERLRALLAAHPTIKPSSLELEVLETSALEDLAQVSQVLEDCRELGVMFALDDFGTGYSSLTYLKRLAVSQLKIDQSFVRDMLEDPDDLAILEGVLGLATAFRRQVIAEGVETVEHGVMLLQLGCELAQGNVIARPMPAAELPGWLAAWRPDPRWVAVSSTKLDDLPLIYAGVEHRAWIMAVESFLGGERKSPPPLDHHQCRFGCWLESEGLAAHGAKPAYLRIEVLHQQAHTLAVELCELQARGLAGQALARLGELHAVRDDLLEQLMECTREGWH
ncbi:MAG: EAL domain-containing protein [Pseudomonadota bacterium]|nr:EAL domain-containing protein [Pseudomonadota bacterium]MDP1905097.1 EAL domain-containing protein [Pseudomonadota bacterium]MDP2354408.1 EAL domain-containing protein [Pseudomonadota bacterium]